MGLFKKLVGTTRVTSAPGEDVPRVQAEVDRSHAESADTGRRQADDRLTARDKQARKMGL